jgi:hypothetical protein
MSINQEQMMQAVYDAIYNAISVTPPGGQPSSAGSPILVMARPGLAVIPKDFTNAMGPANPGGLISSLQVFSEIIDPTPKFDAAYSPGPDLTESYGEVVHGQVDPMKPTEAQQKAYDEAIKLAWNEHHGESAAVIAYRKALADYNAASQKYNSAYWEIDLSTGRGQRKWAAKAPPLRAGVTSAFSKLSATSPGQIENALATIAQFGASGGSVAINQAQQNYLAAKMTGVTPGSEFWPSYAYPSEWMDPASDPAYSQVTISSRSLKLDKSSSYNAYSAGVSASWGLWSVDASSSGKFTHNKMNQDTSDLAVSFKFARVITSRPWVNSGVFSLRGLTVGNRKAGAFSTGKADTSNVGICPLIIDSMIVAKDIDISASWSHEDSEFISKSIKASASVGWGPFKISGSYSHASSNETMNSTFDGTTLKLSGLNIVGFVCALVPFSPAHDG